MENEAAMLARDRKMSRDSEELSLLSALLLALLADLEQSSLSSPAPDLLSVKRGNDIRLCKSFS